MSYTIKSLSALTQEARVVVTRTNVTDYFYQVPFHPPERYSETALPHVDPHNQIYRHVRDTIGRLGLDQENFGTPAWNPLKDIVRPGMTVFIKPNTVADRNLSGHNVLSMITHGSVVRPLLDYVCLALRGEGRIIVGDSPYLFGDFDRAMQITGIGPLVEWYRRQTSIPIECLDLRTQRAVQTWLGGWWGRRDVPADPRGYRWVDLGRRSHFRDIDPKRLRIAVADPREMYKHHSNDRHEYLVPQCVLDCDTIISIPKLKTHRRAAVTLTLKGFFGLVAGKESLPHYTVGSPAEGGDEYVHPSWRKRVYSKLHDLVQSQPLVIQKFLFAMLRNAVWSTGRIVPFKDNVNEAMWYGNDTIWRTILDIHQAVFFADRDGKLHDEPQRMHFGLIDGIIGGEKNGPVAPDPIAPGVLVAGVHPAAIDAVAATLMGFDINKIPTIREMLEYLGANFTQAVEVFQGTDCETLEEFADHNDIAFEPHPDFRGHVELRP